MLEMSLYYMCLEVQMGKQIFSFCSRFIKCLGRGSLLHHPPQPEWLETKSKLQFCLMSPMKELTAVLYWHTHVLLTALFPPLPSAPGLRSVGRSVRVTVNSKMRQTSAWPQRCGVMSSWPLAHPPRIVSSLQHRAPQAPRFLLPWENWDRVTGTSVLVVSIARLFVSSLPLVPLRKNLPWELRQAPRPAVRTLTLLCALSSFPCIFSLSFCPSFIPLVYRMSLCL